jgi:hypothetical protein
MSCIQSEVRDKTDNRFKEDILRSVGNRIINNSDPEGFDCVVEEH